MDQLTQPQIFNLLNADALDVSHSRFGSVGRMFTGQGLEAVWVKKDAEEIEQGWFSQPVVDLILVVQGQLKVEFDSPNQAPRILNPAELLILPPNTRCRAYRWPRDAKLGTVFLAVYPTSSAEI